MRTRELERSELARLQLSPGWAPDQDSALDEEDVEAPATEPGEAPVESGSEDDWSLSGDGAMGLSFGPRRGEDEDEGEVDDDVDFDDFDDDEEIGDDDELDEDDFEDDDDEDEDDLDEDDD